MIKIDNQESLAWRIKSLSFWWSLLPKNIHRYRDRTYILEYYTKYLIDSLSYL